MPFVESFLTTIKNNKSIMSDKSRHFKKTLGGFKWSKNQFDFPEVTKEGLQELRSNLQRQNNVRNIKLSLVFVLIAIVLILIILSL